MFADGFRYRLLLEYGGLWVDTDVVCLRPFDFDHSEIYAWQDEQVINNAVLGLPKGHRLAQWMNDCCEQPDRVLPYDSMKVRRRKLLRRWLPGEEAGTSSLGRKRSGWIDGRQHLHCTERAAVLVFLSHPLLNWHTVFDSSLRDNPSLIGAQLRAASVERDGAPQPRLRQERPLPAGLAVRTFVCALSQKR